MSTELLIELFGYLGSFLVLISFLMVSVVKLRVVNTVGSVIFMIYAFIIKSYPTAIMNLCLVLINLHFLWKMTKSDKEYDLVKVEKNDSFLQYELNKYHDDIVKFFPETDFSLAGVNRGYLVCCQGLPVGITLGNEQDGNFELLLDYSIPEYRDFSIGNYLVSKYAGEGIKKLIFNGDDTHHKEYLEKLGFHKNGNSYEKNI